jgi:hypothetical protein
MMMSPSHFSGIRFGILLHRRGGAGIAERQRLCALGRSGENEQCPDGGKPEYFRHLHLMVSLGSCEPHRRDAVHMLKLLT